MVSIADQSHGLDVTGRVFLTASDQQRRADFRYTGFEHDWTLRIWGRFGIGRLTVIGSHESVQVKGTDGDTVDLQHLEDEHLKEWIAMLNSRGLRNLLFLRGYGDKLDRAEHDLRFTQIDDWRIEVAEETKFEEWVVAKQLRIKDDDVELLILVDDIQMRDSP